MRTAEGQMMIHSSSFVGIAAREEMKSRCSGRKCFTWSWKISPSFPPGTSSNKHHPRHPPPRATAALAPSPPHASLATAALMKSCLGPRPVGVGGRPGRADEAVDVVSRIARLTAGMSSASPETMASSCARAGDHTLELLGGADERSDRVEMRDEREAEAGA